MQEAARQSEGRYKLGPGTLYDNIQRMVDRSLVQRFQAAGKAMIHAGATTA